MPALVLARKHPNPNLADTSGHLPDSSISGTHSLLAALQAQVRLRLDKPMCGQMSDEHEICPGSIHICSVDLCMSRKCTLRRYRRSTNDARLLSEDISFSCALNILFRIYNAVNTTLKILSSFCNLFRITRIHSCPGPKYCKGEVHECARRLPIRSDWILIKYLQSAERSSIRTSHNRSRNHACLSPSNMFSLGIK